MELIKHKQKHYEFSYKGLEELKMDCIKRRINIISNFIFYGGIGVLIVCGFIGFNGLLKMGLGMGTNKSVRWLCRKGII